MNSSNQAIWAIGAGDNDRAYYELFLHWDIIALGPGTYGFWDEQRYEKENKLEKHEFRDLQLFYNEMKSGDIVVLRLGTRKICGIGRISTNEGNCAWYDDFGDIDGWDLQHTKRISWIWKIDENDKSDNGPEKNFKWGYTISKENIAIISSFIEKKRIELNTPITPLVKLPKTCIDKCKLRRLEVRELSENQNVVHGLEPLFEISRHYLKRLVEGELMPSEDETRVYLVVPLLKSLGWSFRCMAVEWKNLDIALFENEKQLDANLLAIVEVKKFDISCLTAKDQVEGYAEKHGKKQCRLLILTDGMRYGVFTKEYRSSFTWRLYAYMNLNRLVESYPIIGLGAPCYGPNETLRVMSPAWDGTLLT